jgi:hypothetical protein
MTVSIYGALMNHLLAEGINNAPEPPCCIQRPLDLAIQQVLDRNQIAQFIGERGDVVQRIFDRERWALGIDRDRRDLIECIRDRREVALEIIAKRRRVVQWIGDVEGGARSSTAPHASIFREHLM